MYVVEIKKINEVYDFRIASFRAIGAEEAAMQLDLDRKEILQHVKVVSEDTKPSPKESHEKIKLYNGREF